MVEEFTLIERYFAPLTHKVDGAFALTDDAAVLPASREGYDTIMTKDALVENVHFFAGTAADKLARKIMGVNLSDVASMGANPRYYLISAVINATVDEAWLALFAKELRVIQEEYGVVLVGGDTVKHDGALSFSVTMMGEVPKGKAVRRKGASTGDRIYVSGTIGDAALGLTLLQQGNDREVAEFPFLVERYHVPCPRNVMAEIVCDYVVAATDVSDGLLADLQHICDVSNVGARVEEACIPLSDEARKCLVLYPQWRELIAVGGDDYELLMIVPEARADRFEAAMMAESLVVTRIGAVVDGQEVVLIDEEGNKKAVTKKGFSH